MQGAVDETADWVAVSQIAERFRVSRQAVSKRVAKLREGGKLQTRGEGRALRVHLPTYESLVSEAHDPAQDLRNRHVKRSDDEEAVAPKAESPREPSVFDNAAAREKNAKAQLAELQLAQKRAELVRARDLEGAAVEIGTTIAQIVNANMSQFGKVYAAARAGEDAVRIEMLAIKQNMLQSIAEAMGKIAARGATENP